MSQIKKGAILNYLTIILTNIVGLLLTPFIISKLGDSEFGLYTLIGALVGYISILDFGLSNTIIRFVAKFKAENDRKGEENFLATSMIIYIIISILVIIIGTLCYFKIEDIFKNSLTFEQIDRAKIMFIILIFNLAISLPGGTFNGICLGYEQFVFPKTVNIIRYIVRSFTIVAVLLLGGKAISMVIVDTILNIAIGTINAYYVFRKLNVRIKLHYLDKSLMKEIFHYSIWIFVWVLVGQFQWQIGQMVLGIMTNTTVVAIFSVGILLGTYYGAFSSAITGVFLPRATQMTVNNATPKELTDMMIKIGRISFILLLYILGAFILYGKQFVFLWVGEIYYDSWRIGVIIMLGLTFPLAQYFGTSILEARGKIAFKAIIYLIFLIIGTGSGALLVKNYGAIGMISGSVSGMILAQLFLNIYYYKMLELDMIRFFKELFSKSLITFIFVLIIGYFINFIPGMGWINFIFKAMIYSLIFGLLFFNLGMIEYEKQLFSKPILEIINKINRNR